MQLINFLQENSKVFAWSLRDMLGIDPDMARHHLNISPEAQPVKQKPCRFIFDRQQAISDKVDKLLGVGFLVNV